VFAAACEKKTRIQSAERAGDCFEEVIVKRKKAKKTSKKK
jgi:hypothetical protein